MEFMKYLRRYVVFLPHRNEFPYVDARDRNT
jgi:hypothetical protein